MPKDYELEIWADGFANWHGVATFPNGLGNTGEAERVLTNARAAVRRAIRKEILARSPRQTTAKDLSPIRLTVAGNTFVPGLGTLKTIEWMEA